MTNGIFAVNSFLKIRKIPISQLSRPLMTDHQIFIFILFLLYIQLEIEFYKHNIVANKTGQKSNCDRFGNFAIDLRIDDGGLEKKFLEKLFINVF